MSSEVDLGSGEVDCFSNRDVDSEHLVVFPSIPITDIVNGDDYDEDDDDELEEEEEDSKGGFDQEIGDSMEISDNDEYFGNAEGYEEPNSNDSFGFGQDFKVEEHFLSPSSQDLTASPRKVGLGIGKGGKIRGNRVPCPKCGKLVNKANLGVHIRAAHPTGVKSYSCEKEDCAKSFHTKKRLDYHVANEHEDGRIDNVDVPDNRECPVCKVVIRSLADYKYHVQRDHIHACDNCELKFAAKQKLEEHVLAVHNIDIRVDKTCQLCGAVQRGLTDYYRHIVKDHNWSCDFDGCNLKFAAKQKLEDHTLQVHNIDIKVEKRCNLCQQDIPSLSDFRQHMARDHKYACVDEKCELRFASKQKFEEHTLQAHNIDVRIDRTCPQCQNLIRGLTDYFRHIQKDHKFKCEECPLKFAYKLKFEEHMLSNHGKDVKVDKTCQLCKTSIRSLTDYRRHIAMVHKFDCVCELKFACKQKLEEHTLKVHGIDIRVDKTCPMCKTSIRSLSDYNRHIATEHRWQCPHCDLKFAYKQKLDEHGIQVHEVEIGHIPLFSCQTCGLTFDHKPVFENHLELPHSVSCAYCDMMFTYHHKMVQHCEKDHQLLVESKEEQLTCNLCKLTFPTTSRMEQHCSMGHKFSCVEDGCDLIFVSKFKLEEHAADVHNLKLDPDKSHVCSQCGQCFSRPENLKKHEERPHEFPCDHCEKTFIAQDRLEKHSIKEHGILGEHAVDDTADLKDSMVCPLCDKNFRQLHILRKHKEIEHKFACTGCDKKFTMKHWLKEHMKVVHDIEDELKPSLKCELCDNIFNDNYGYRKHQKIDHTYECTYCNKRFTMKKFLNTHQFYVHNMVARGMKVPTQDQKEEAIIKAFKEEMKELKKESLKMEDPYFRIKTELPEFPVKSEPFDEHEMNGMNDEMNGTNGIEIKPKSKKPPPPLIKIEQIPSEDEEDSEEETEPPFVNDVVQVTDMQSASEDEDKHTEDDDDSVDEDMEVSNQDLVSVQPQYESSEEEDSDDEERDDGQDASGFMEPFIQIEEDQDSS